MHSIPILFTLWPGLPQLWLYGRLSGLLNAIAFAVFLNFVLFATYQQTDVLSKSGLISCWILVGVFWTVAIFQNDWAVKEYARKNAQTDSSELDELFQLGQSEYLQGRLSEAETLFERILCIDPRDADARLYLATINRHQGKLNQASKHLDVLEDSDCEKWHYQITDERAMVGELESELTMTSGQLVDGQEDDSNEGFQSAEKVISEEISFEDGSKNGKTAEGNGLVPSHSSHKAA